MPKRIDLTPEQLDTARRLRSEGHSFRAIAGVFGVQHTKIRMALLEVTPAPPKPKIAPRPHPESVPAPDVVSARLAEIPSDTRSLTARVLGDPLPGRSALDRRHQGA